MFETDCRQIASVTFVLGVLFFLLTHLFKAKFLPLPNRLRKLTESKRLHWKEWLGAVVRRTSQVRGLNTDSSELVAGN